MTKLTESHMVLEVADKDKVDPYLNKFVALTSEELERFVTLVAAHEREACAKVVEDYCGAWGDEGYALAAAIRARGKQ